MLLVALTNLVFCCTGLSFGRISPDDPDPHDGIDNGRDERVAWVELRTAVFFQLARAPVGVELAVAPRR
jgi:hypothetical protein